MHVVQHITDPSLANNNWISCSKHLIDLTLQRGCGAILGTGYGIPRRSGAVLCMKRADRRAVGFAFVIAGLIHNLKYTVTRVQFVS